MARPTENAETFFKSASANANHAIVRINGLPATNENQVQKELLQAIWGLAIGLEHLSVGLRATYILLETKR